MCIFLDYGYRGVLSTDWLVKRPTTFFSWTHIGQGPYLLYPQIKYSTSSTCYQNSNLARRCHCKIRGNNVKPHRGWLYVCTYTCMQMFLNRMLKQYLCKFSHFLFVRRSGWASVKRHCFPVDIGSPVAMDHPRALDVCRPTGELAKWSPVRCWLRERRSMGWEDLKFGTLDVAHLGIPSGYVKIAIDHGHL